MNRPLPPMPTPTGGIPFAQGPVPAAGDSPNTVYTSNFYEAWFAHGGTQVPDSKKIPAQNFGNMVSEVVVRGVVREYLAHGVGHYVVIAGVETQHLRLEVGEIHE